MIKRITAAIPAVLLVLMAGCGDSGAIGIIGGYDSPSSIVERSQAMAVPESPPAESDTGSSQPESSLQPESTPEPTATPTAAPTVTPAPTAKPTASPSPKPTETPKPAPTGDADYYLSSDTVKTGDMLTLTCKNASAEELSLKVSLNGIFQLLQNGDDAVALLGVSRNIAPGSYKAVVSDGATQVAVLPFTVVDAGFQREEFQMAEGTVNSTVNNSTARDEYNRITANVMAADKAEPNFPDTDGFIMPINPPTFKISSSYGFTRVVNGKVSGRHEGVDFPAPKGTPVVAAGSGRVLYSGLMQMTGNTVIIEHGMGLKSWYHHMDSLSCETGDILEAGDPVGKVGTTGYSTGNHLHFGMSINDTYTNPWQFIPKP